MSQATLPENSFGNSTHLKIAQKLHLISKDYEIGNARNYRNIFESMSDSLRSENASSAYQELEASLFGKLFTEINQLATELENPKSSPEQPFSTVQLQLMRENLSLLANKCLLLFRARTLLYPTHLKKSELELFQYMENAPDDLVEADKILWFTTETNIAQLKYKTITNKVHEATAEANKTLQLIHEEKEKFLDIADNHTRKFSTTLDEHTNKLGNEFEKYKKTKLLEQNWIIVLCLILISGIIAVGYQATLSYHDLVDKALKKEFLLTYEIIFANTWGFAVAEIFQFYLFRIALHNYYAARDEVLQLGLREAVCRFLPIFREFSEKNNCDLAEFSKLIFSPLNSRLGKTPKITDPVTELASAIKSLKKTQ